MEFWALYFLPQISPNTFFIGIWYCLEIRYFSLLAKMVQPFLCGQGFSNRLLKISGMIFKSLFLSFSFFSSSLLEFLFPDRPFPFFFSLLAIRPSPPGPSRANPARVDSQAPRAWILLPADAWGPPVSGSFSSSSPFPFAVDGCEDGEQGRWSPLASPSAPPPL